MKEYATHLTYTAGATIALCVLFVTGFTYCERANVQNYTARTQCISQGGSVVEISDWRWHCINPKGAPQ